MNLNQISMAADRIELEEKFCMLNIGDKFEVEDKFRTMKILVEDRVFFICPTFLSVNSSVFAAMFHAAAQGYVEAKSIQEIQLIGDKWEEVLSLLQVLHLEARVNDRNVESLLRLADKYDVPRIKSFCSNFLIASWAQDSRKWIDALKLAQKYEIPDVVTVVLRNLKEKSKKFCEHATKKSGRQRRIADCSLKRLCRLEVRKSFKKF